METKKTPAPDGPRVAVLGGGNGTSHLLTALLPLLHAGEIASLHALVQMADDGGSTGRLREQYGVAAVGDLTKCLLALSSLRGDIRGDDFLQALEYRFTDGDLRGHTLRNIFLTALEKVSGPSIDGQVDTGIDAAIATMARVLQVPKHAGVIPTTMRPLTQQVVISFSGRQELLGEGQHSIAHKVNLQADPRWQPGDVRVTFAHNDVPLSPRGRDVLSRATHIIVAPGHTYGTILPTLALPALSKGIQETSAKLLVVMTLLTTPRQTSGWRGEDFVRVYESYLGRTVDAVIGNTGSVDVELVPGQAWVRFADTKHPYTLLQADVVSTQAPAVQDGDSVPRAVVIHDAAKIQTILRDLIIAR